MANPEHRRAPGHFAHSHGAVRYLDRESLHRPLDMPKNQFRSSFVFVAVACVIAVMMFANYYNGFLAASANTSEKVQQEITRAVKLDLPKLADFITMSNADIKDELAAGGYTIYDNSGTTDTAAGGVDLYKLPSDITLADAAVAYASGINKLSADSAAKYLTGSWRLLTNHTSGTELKLRYADFNSITADDAVTNAMTSQDFDTSAAGAMGKDTVGNTVQSGTIVVDGTTYYWTVSVCALSSVYNIDGLPTTAQYVGIRLATSNS